MSLPDTVFIFALALIIFGPKKLPEIGRQLGKLVLEFRRASNEFKMQIEEELRTADEADRQKKIAAQNAAPASPAAATSETLTIRPPSTGTMESAENPFKGYFEQEEPVQPETEAATTPETYETQSVTPEPQEQGTAPAQPASLIVSDSQETLGDYETIAGNQEKTVSEREDLEEQTAHHHG